MKNKVLFVCVHNTARSPMAQALVNDMCSNSFEAYSAGITAGELNPVAVQAMNEIGIDISHHKPSSVLDLYKSGVSFNYVIALCDEAAGERCPTVPGFAKRIDWSFEDPALLADALPADARLKRMQSVRDEIRAAISRWCAEVC